MKAHSNRTKNNDADTWLLSTTQDTGKEERKHQKGREKEMRRKEDYSEVKKNSRMSREKRKRNAVTRSDVAPSVDDSLFHGPKRWSSAPPLLQTVSGAWISGGDCQPPELPSARRDVSGASSKKCPPRGFLPLPRCHRHQRPSPFPLERNHRIQSRDDDVSVQRGRMMMRRTTGIQGCAPGPRNPVNGGFRMMSAPPLLLLLLLLHLPPAAAAAEVPGKR